MPNYSYDKDDLKRDIQDALDNKDLGVTDLADTLRDWEEMEKQEEEDE